MRTAGTSVPHRQHHISRQLALDVQIELLNHALFTLAVPSLDGSRIAQTIHRRDQDRAASHVRGRRRTSRDQEAIRETAAGASRGGTKPSPIHFRIIWRILPQPLSTLVPRGIVDDTVAPPNSRLLAAHGLPGESDPGFQSGFVKLNTHSPIRRDADRAAAYARAVFRDEPLKARNIEIRLPVGLLGYRRRQGPGKSEIHGQIGGDPPVTEERSEEHT